MNPPTARQLAVLRVIRAYHQAKGFPISVRELGNALKISSTNAVNDHLRALEKKGLVTHVKSRARTLQLTAAGRQEVLHG